MVEINLVAFIAISVSVFFAGISLGMTICSIIYYWPSSAERKEARDRRRSRRESRNSGKNSRNPKV